MTFRESSGGLVSGLSAYLDGLQHSQLDTSNYVWIGWPGRTVRARRQAAVVERAHAEFHAHPVFVSESEMDQFYHGFCNEIIWPLFHYFPTYAVYDEVTWASYRAINERFRDAIVQIARPDDVIWVHDYHLMLLPAMLRELLPAASIGFFLHIPFPAFEIFRLLPAAWREPIIEGMLGADVVGFHTADYVRYFLDSVARLTGQLIEGNRVAADHGTVSVEAFPMGIDVDRFRAATTSAAVRQHRDRLTARLDGQKAILSLDRLDYSKGILNRLLAFERFLETQPEWRGRVTLIVVVVPSRIGVRQYQQLKRQIEENVGRINGRYGEIGWHPITYTYRFVPFEELVATYATCDLALITPMRDGMNLVAKEYVASQDDNGVLILSEFAGAAQELAGAILVNPNSVEEIAAAIAYALEASPSERATRHAASMAGVEASNVTGWAERFMRRLAKS